MRRILAATLLLAVTAAAPVAAAALQLPAYTRTTLDNGLIVYVMPTRRLPLVEFRLLVRAGSVSDPHGREGLASLTADLLTQGAGARSAQQIAEDIAFVGGSLNAFASTEQVVVTCEVLKKDFAVGLELLRDVTLSPTFPAEEVGRKKDEALGAIASQRDDPGTLANLELGPFLLGDSPLAHPVMGWEKSVATLTRDDVTAFHGQHFRPDQAMLAVVGDVEPAAVKAALDKAFGSWKANGARPGEAYSAVPQARGRRVLIVKKPEVTQTQIRLACMGVPRNHPDYYPITVANTILGAGFTSRLVNEIRVVQGLTYSISSRFGMFRNAGTFRVSTFTKNETLRKTIDETIKVVKAVAVVDCGRTISPDGVANQVEGGIVQAVSWVLKEQVRFDRSRITTRSWDDYPILRFSEAPPVEVTIIDRPDQPSLGMGEAVAGPTAAAIANAVFDAIGVRVRELPLTRERMMMAINNA